MHCQVLASGSKGNVTLLRAGELSILIDCGLSLRELRARLETAGLPHRGIGHVLVTHGHLDHARSAGALAKRHGATLHCAESNMQNRALSRAPTFQALHIGSETEIAGPNGSPVTYTPALRPHDCDPTVAFRLEHESRVLVILTDLGHPSREVARALRGAHVLILEFNHDQRMLAEGPYPAPLKRRVSGDRGHLSNEQAAVMLMALAGPELHTLVLAHLSATNNTPEMALEAARGALSRAGLEQVEVLVASQDEVGPNLKI
ncbi:MAG: MBL fold metallo-hydrolase [Planctomycetota bacterium]